MARRLETIASDQKRPPLIAPVREGAWRPKWSVMIPTFNCADYLRITLQSLLDQVPGPDEMQIEVVDDCSTKDNPEAVVQELGRGRAQFFRQPGNVGAIENFNTCVRRSRGHYVHLLHGDDLVCPGFYSAFEEALTTKEVGIVSARNTRSFHPSFANFNLHARSCDWA